MTRACWVMFLAFTRSLFLTAHLARTRSWQRVGVRKVVWAGGLKPSHLPLSAGESVSGGRGTPSNTGAVLEVTVYQLGHGHWPDTAYPDEPI